MRIYKNRYTFCLILTLIILSSAGVFFPIKNSSFEPISEGHDALNLSDDELVIITPENKTYIEPMSGYYPATYGFENDEDGTVPEGWIDQDAYKCVSQIISGLNGHNKILQQYDNNNGEAAVVKRTFTSNKDYGTIEYYVRASLMTGGAKMSWLLWSASGFEIWMVMGDSKLTYLDGVIWQDIIPSGLTANIWYHFSVRWRCTGAPVYEGLNEGEWKIFIDEVEYGNYALLHDDNMTNVNLETGPVPEGFSVYWDAVGFDWKDDYIISDNLNEGLFLSFESTITLDWVGYSLDGQAKVTILGNATIPMPEDGSHSIQIFGNDTLGTNYHSDIKYFSVDTGSPEITIITPVQDDLYGDIPPNFELSILKPDISKIWYTLDNGITNITSAGLTGTINQIEWEKKGGGPVTIGFYANDTLGFEGYSEVTVNKIAKIYIDSPENKTYIEPMSGYYPATYGFENDEDGSFPMGLIDDSVGASSEVIVESEMAGHKKVLHYNSLVHASYASTITNLSSSQTSGTIEYYVYKDFANGGFEVSLRNSTGDYALRIGIDYWNDGQFIWRTSSSTFAQFGAGKYSDNSWFHIRIDFDILTKKFDIYLDGIKEVDQEDIFYDINSVQHVRFDQTGTYSGWYLDALSFSWDPKYNTGDNSYEGLLLSFENDTALDWMGYSLDGQANKTILGNNTIKMPDDGLHTIQLFGNNSLGTIIQSDVRYFSVDTGSPQITILTPIQNEFFGVVPPNFEIFILKPDISKIWYTLDGGITNVTSVGLTGTMNQTEWDKIVADIVTIKFYANDIFGFEGNAEVVINKDLNAPNPSISQEALTFTITADDGSGSGVALIRYRINGSAWIEYTSSFNLDYGYYNITFQAIDEVGNIGNGGLIIALREPDIQDEPPDWTIIIMTTAIIGGIGLVIVITLIIRKRK